MTPKLGDVKWRVAIINIIAIGNISYNIMHTFTFSIARVRVKPVHQIWCVI